MPTPRDTPDLAPARLRVAASTSNLGPGFDALGLALGLWLDVVLLGPSTTGAHVLRDTTGHARAWPRESNVMFDAFDDVFDACGISRMAVEFEAHSEIPLERGLGSSGAAVAAGLLLANHCLGDPLERDALAELGLRREGHPDNSTASLFGGCTLGVPTSSGLRILQPALHDALGFAVAWSDVPLATERARAALPDSIPFTRAVENPRRLPLLLEGLRRADRALVEAGGEDALHVEHRLPLIPGGAAALTAAREAGAWTATISGAGSALVAIAARDETETIGAAMANALRTACTWSEHRALQAATEAPQVRRTAP